MSSCVSSGPSLNEDPVALADLVAAYGLPVVEDPTNELVDRARNLVRHQVLPVLCDINPGAVIISRVRPGSCEMRMRCCHLLSNPGFPVWPVSKISMACN